MTKEGGAGPEGTAGSWGSSPLLNRGGGAFALTSPPTLLPLIPALPVLMGMSDLGALSGALHLDLIILPYFLFFFFILNGGG